MEFRRDDDGTFSYGVWQWFDKDPCNPYEREPGYWTPVSGSGIYSTLDIAKSEAASAWPEIFEGEEQV